MGTIEEKLLAMHAEKRDLADALLHGAEGAGTLDVDALLALLADGPASAVFDAPPIEQTPAVPDAPPQARPSEVAIEDVPSPAAPNRATSGLDLEALVAAFRQASPASGPPASARAPRRARCGPSSAWWHGSARSTT